MDNEEVKSLLQQMLFKYLPFIIEMMKKVKGTAIEGKWLMMRDQMMNPQKKLSIEKLKSIENMLEGLKKREEKKLETVKNDEKDNKLTPCENATNDIMLIDGLAVNDNQVEIERYLNVLPEEGSKFSHDLACEHSYARSVASEDSNDGWITKRAKKNTKKASDSSFTAVEKSSDKNLTNAEVNKSSAITEPIKQDNNSCSELKHNITKAPSRRSSIKRSPVTYKESAVEEFSNYEFNWFRKRKRSLPTVEKVEELQTEKLFKKATEQRQDDENFKGWDRSEVENGVIFTKNPHQPPKVPPPVPEFSPWIYESIFNIAFAKSRRGFVFKCLIQGCRFQTLVKEAMMNHLQSRHAKQEWNGFCNSCAKEVEIGESTVLAEFQHMSKLHVQPKERDVLPVFSPKTSPVKNAKVSESRDEVKSKKIAMTTSTPLIKKLQTASFKLTPSVTIKSAVTVNSLLAEMDLLAKKSAESRVKVSINLRPWMKAEKLKKKSEDSASKMLSKEALCSMYKCMASTCSFFTTDKKLFRKHLTLHEQFTSSDKGNFLSCSYCNFVATTSKVLEEHLDKIHVYDRFQCNFCFYRSCANFNVLNHQLFHHEEEENIIYECPMLKQRDQHAELEEIKKIREENVPPIVCVFCRGMFFAKTAFVDHLTTHAVNLKARCITCGEETSNKTIADHLEKCHNIGLYQCVYCPMGTDTFDKLSTHIANEHPSKRAVFCERTELRNPDGTLKHNSPSVIETTSLKNIKQAVSPNCIFQAPNNQKLMRNEENVGKLRHDLHIHKNDSSPVKPTNQQLLSKIIRPIGKSH